MIVQCADCKNWYDDEFRLTYCPHAAFAANDGTNHFHIHTDAYLSADAPEDAPPGTDGLNFPNSGIPL
jgi:hypothetical protein